MNAKELYTAGGKPTGIFYCGECNKLQPIVTSREAAEACCRPKLCKCGAEIPPGRYTAKCDECRRAEAARAKELKLQRAETVETLPDDCILFDDAVGEYYQDWEEYFDATEDYPEYREKFLFLAKFEPVRLPCALDLLEPCTEYHHEAIGDRIPDLTKLDAAIDEANQMFAEQRWGSYGPDYTRKVEVVL